MSTKAREATVISETTGKIHGTGEVNGNNPNKRSPPIEKGGKISQEHSHCQRISKFPNLSPSFFSPTALTSQQRHRENYNLRRRHHIPPTNQESSFGQPLPTHTPNQNQNQNQNQRQSQSPNQNLTPTPLNQNHHRPYYPHPNCPTYPSKSAAHPTKIMLFQYIIPSVMSPQGGCAYRSSDRSPRIEDRVSI